MYVYVLKDIVSVGRGIVKDSILSVHLTEAGVQAAFEAARNKYKVELDFNVAEVLGSGSKAAYSNHQITIDKVLAVE